MNQVSAFQPYTYPLLASKGTANTTDTNSRHIPRSESEAMLNGTHAEMSRALMAFGEFDEGVPNPAFVCTEGAANEGPTQIWAGWPNKCHEQLFFHPHGMPAIMSEETLTTQQITTERLPSEDFVHHANGGHDMGAWTSASFLFLPSGGIAQQEEEDEHAMIPIASMHTAGHNFELTAYPATLATYYTVGNYGTAAFETAPNTPESMDYAESTISPKTLQRYAPDQQFNEGGYQSGSDSFSVVDYETDSRGSTPGHGGSSMYEYKSFYEPALAACTEIKNEDEDYNHLLEERKASESIEPSFQDYYPQRTRIRNDELIHHNHYMDVQPYDLQAHNKREEENELLKELREKNHLSYKEIRARFGNRYTESTLRGRYRTISKKREERVRKPKWYGNDVRLLNNAVKATSQPHDLSTVKWKDIAEQIFANDGSYKFGVTTCKKKYLEVLQRGLDEVVRECGAEYPPPGHIRASSRPAQHSSNNNSNNNNLFCHS